MTAPRRAVMGCLDCDSSWEVYVASEGGGAPDAGWTVVEGDVECPDCGSASTDLTEVD